MQKQIMNKRFRKGITILTFTLMLCFGVSVMAQTAVMSEEGNYTEVWVENGDTLWSIAERVAHDGVDKRKIVYEIQTINKVDDYIYPGQLLFVPIVD